MRFPVLRMIAGAVFFCTTLSGGMWCSAQSSPATVYMESFRQGATRIAEDHFAVKLTPHDPIFRESIKDSGGDDHYALSITPHGPEGDSEITCWEVKLMDRRHSMYENILLPSKYLPENSQDDSRFALWRLDPGKSAPVPVTARRIFKIDNFYLVLQVKAIHFTPPESPYLDSMEVFTEFTNTDPRAPSVQK